MRPVTPAALTLAVIGLVLAPRGGAAQFPFALSADLGNTRIQDHGEFEPAFAPGFSAALHFGRPLALAVSYRRVSQTCADDVEACVNGVDLAMRSAMLGVRWHPMPDQRLDPWVELAVAWNRLEQSGIDVYDAPIAFGADGYGQVLTAGAQIPLGGGLHLGPFVQLHRTRLEMDFAPPAGYPVYLVRKVLGERAWTGNRIALFEITVGARLTVGPFGAVSPTRAAPRWRDPGESAGNP